LFAIEVYIYIYIAFVIVLVLTLGRALINGGIVAKRVIVEC